jgi:hypothetical protein
MFDTNDLSREIDQVLHRTIGKKHPDWITEAVMQLHPVPEGDDADFYLCCARAWVRQAVGRRLGRAKLSALRTDDERQDTLEGFERVQKEYLLEEDGVSVSVPIEDMSDAQIIEKETELIAMGSGCFEHAAELQRYRLARAAGRTGGEQA